MQHQEPEEPDKTALAVVDYPRRRRRPSVTFAGWFVTIGAINLLFGSLTFAATCLRLSTVAVTWLKGPSGIFQFPLTDLIMGAFMLLASGLIVAGSFGSFWRKLWSVKLVRSGLAGVLTIHIGDAAVLLYYHDRLPSGLLTTIIVWTTIGPMIYAAISLWLYNGLRADFYFVPTDSEIIRNSALPALNEVVIPRPMLPPTARFEILGRDRRTGESVRLMSRAATEALARRSGIVMGMSEDSIEVVAISADHES